MYPLERLKADIGQTHFAEDPMPRRNHPGSDAQAWPLDDASLILWSPAHFYFKMLSINKRNMVNFNRNTIIISVVAFVLMLLLPMLVPYLKGLPNIILFPVAFTVFATLVSKAGKLPIREKGDVHAIAIMMVAFSASLFLVDALFGGGFSVYSIFLLLIYGFIPHLFLSMIFGVNKVEAKK